MRSLQHTAMKFLAAALLLLACSVRAQECPNAAEALAAFPDVSDIATLIEGFDLLPYGVPANATIFLPDNAAVAELVAMVAPLLGGKVSGHWGMVVQAAFMQGRASTGFRGSARSHRLPSDGDAWSVERCLFWSRCRSLLFESVKRSPDQFAACTSRGSFGARWSLTSRRRGGEWTNSRATRNQPRTSEK